MPVLALPSVVYSVPVYLCFLAASQKNNHLLFYLPISLLTISDTMAEWSGKRWSNRSRRLMKDQKTIAGSLAFSLSALLICIGWGIVYGFGFHQIITLSILTTFVATIAELISTRGFDNITVPLISLLCLWFLVD